MKWKELTQDLPTQSWKQRMEALRYLPSLLKLVWKISPGLMSSVLILRAISSLPGLALLVISKFIMDRVVQIISGRRAMGSDLWTLLACEFAVIAVADILGRLVDLCENMLLQKSNNALTLKVMEHAATLDLATLEDPAFHDNLERTRNQASSRLGFLTASLQAGQQILTVLSVSATLAYYSPLLLPVLALCVVPSFIGESRFAALNYSLLRKRTAGRRELDYLSFLAASTESAKEVKIFALEGHLMARYQRLAQRFIQETLTLARRRAAMGFIFGLSANGGYYIAYALLLRAAVQGRCTVGDLTLVAGALIRARSALQSILGSVSQIAEQGVHLLDFFEFFEVRSRLVEPVRPVTAPRAILDGFEFQDVSFHYPNSSRIILQNVNFRLSAGEKMALVGENGAGKTTLVKLVSRLYDPSAGRILLDGVDLRDYRPADIYRLIAVVFQDYLRYQASARENIGYGHIDAMDDDLRIRLAAKAGLAEPVIARLPRGYDQLLGRRFEGGVNLSDGEWQRLALSRACMRGARLLILDEPAASLDPKAEDELYARFSRMGAESMAILISHRFSTVRLADRILVLEGGRLAEQGTHAELVARGEVYAELYRRQAVNYQ